MDQHFESRHLIDNFRLLKFGTHTMGTKVGDTLEQMKRAYVEYYADVPIQKYAAMSIARDEDTIIRWRKEDLAFADAVQKAKADWIRKKLIATKAEFALERLEREVFSPSHLRSDITDEVVQVATIIDLSRTDPIH